MPRFMRSRTLWIAFLLALLTAPVLATSVQAEDVVEETKAQQSRGTGEDENIKERSPKNDPKAEAPAPPTKGGEKARGACGLVVDNWTPWKVQIYVDGTYVGLVDSWGAASGWYASGRHVVYGVAEFWNAPDQTWGPQRISCSGTYTWKLIR